ncbi:tyrosine-type recombinase/integrase [Gulosibacter faecalis]|uniref:Tyrosine-type recombinase/integrase n=1 Tax=Gulosibacter faecalis TaxID=272240 RepID=A0ABW5UUG0_9MICO|nr:site-specific integrase [Gulosibacter faecalis]
MAKSWVTDLWTKTAIIGGERVAPTAAQLRKIKSLPDEFRTARFGKGNRWRVGWVDPQGKQRTRTYATRAAADEYAASLDEDLRVGRYTSPENAGKTFDDVATLWLASKRKAKGSTIWRYTRDLDRWVRPKWGSMPIGQIDRAAVETWVDELTSGTAPISQDAKRRNVGGLAPKTVQGIVGIAFGSPMRWALEQRWITENPLRRIELPQPDDGDDETPALSYLEVELLADAVRTIPRPKRAVNESDGQVSYTLVQFLAYTGLRINEACALDWRDVDLHKRRVRVRSTWTVDKTGKRVIGPPKGWERRTVPLPAHVVALLEATERKDRVGWVFKSPRGEALDDKNWRNRVWAPAIREVGLDGFTIHGLRHTAVSNAIAAGADVKLIQLMCGHKSATMTLDVYGHLWPDRLDEVVDAVSEARRRALVVPVRLVEDL